MNSLIGMRLAALDALEQPEVGAREQADVLRVLPVDLLDAARDDELHSRLELAVRRGLPARAAALGDAADDDAEAAALDAVLLDDAAAEADQAVPSERLVVVVANPPRRELVGGDVREEGEPARPVVRQDVRRAQRPRPCELGAQEVGILGEVEDATVEADRAGGARHARFLSMGRAGSGGERPRAGRGWRGALDCA